MQLHKTRGVGSHLSRRKTACYCSRSREGPTTVCLRSFHSTIQTLTWTRRFIIFMASETDQSVLEWPQLICLHWEKVSNPSWAPEEEWQVGGRVYFVNHVWAYVNRRLTLCSLCMSLVLSSYTIGLWQNPSNSV